LGVARAARVGNSRVVGRDRVCNQPVRDVPPRTESHSEATGDCARPEYDFVSPRACPAEVNQKIASPRTRRGQLYGALRWPGKPGAPFCLAQVADSGTNATLTPIGLVGALITQLDHLRLEMKRNKSLDARPSQHPACEAQTRERWCPKFKRTIGQCCDICRLARTGWAIARRSGGR
jgi:hypothetical protein